MPGKKNLQWYVRSVLNSYSQVFFSDNKIFAVILLLITFVDFYTGLFGLMSVLVTTAMARWIGFDKFKIEQGYYGFNSLLVGLGIGIYFQPGMLLVLIVVLSAVLTLFFSVAMEGIIGKYALPYLSLPFVFALWAVSLASREFQALGLNERGIYTLNELYLIGGKNLVRLYEWWGNVPIPSSVRTYFLSLGAIFFQSNVLTGILIAAGLLIYSRIAFSLSLLGFYTAYLFYLIIGAAFSEVGYSYIGFNYILSAIAIGGYFIIPHRSSYLWVMILIPLVAILTLSLSEFMSMFQLPILSLPFNVLTLLFLYVLKFRLHNRISLSTLFIQQNSPEKNLYSFLNFTDRFGKDSSTPIHLPFFGEWTVTQAHNGEYTHKDAWRHAWDFEITDEHGKTFGNKGDYTKDYYCFDKFVVAPADGQIEAVVDNIEDNIIGEKNLEHNWGNTIVIKHHDRLYSKLSHLKQGSIDVKEGNKVKKGDILARCGNSGYSPFPHLHFQLQETPFVGSRTIEYPVSNYLVNRNGIHSLKTVSIPQKGDVVSNIQINPSLKKAFFFIPGEQIKLVISPDNNNAYYENVWDVKRDAYLNNYIRCAASGSRAYFKTDGTLLHFTHFEGSRDSILYYFFLGAYTVCMGHYKNLVLTDSYPLNKVFGFFGLFLQDFIAPFYLFAGSRFALEYTTLKESLSGSVLLLKAQSGKTWMGRQKSLAQVEFTVNQQGLKEFHIVTPRKNLQVTCEKRPS